MGLAEGFWHLSHSTIHDDEGTVNGVGRRLLALEWYNL